MSEPILVDQGHFEAGDVSAAPRSLAEFVGHTDVLMITLDTLRYDVAEQLWRQGRLPCLQSVMPSAGWECRHSPATFTYAAHHAFFSGFLPTPAKPGLHPRLFASRFSGSETTGSQTFVFDEATLPQALSTRGYKTICVGGTGFFNLQTAMGRVLPSLFDEACWTPKLGVTDRQSEVNQVQCAMDRLAAADDQLAFTFINMSAVHQPNWFYEKSQKWSAEAAEADTMASHAAALVAVDQALLPLFQFCRQRRPTFCIVCSDHGTAYGEDGYSGHRVAHEVVWNVPYSEFLIS